VSNTVYTKHSTMTQVVLTVGEIVMMGELGLLTGGGQPKEREKVPGARDLSSRTKVSTQHLRSATSILISSVMDFRIL
jgi:hypothetical protein